MESIWSFAVPLGLGFVLGISFAVGAYMYGKRRGQKDGKHMLLEQQEKERMAKLRKLRDAGRRQEKRSDAGPPARIHNAKIHSPYRPKRGYTSSWREDDQR